MIWRSALIQQFDAQVASSISRRPNSSIPLGFITRSAVLPRIPLVHAMPRQRKNTIFVTAHTFRRDTKAFSALLLLAIACL
jgi:hypothetical protein